MENMLLQESLSCLLARVAHENNAVKIPNGEWQHAYNAFCDRVGTIVDGTCCPEMIRTLDYARIELETLLEEIDKAKPYNADAAICCAKALKILRCELHIVDLRLKHPGFLPESELTAAKSPLYLSEEYHVTDLVELITPLYELSVLRTHDGQRAKLCTIVRIFEWAFNISMPNYDGLRIAAVNRKIRLTRFLDKLRGVMVELSQR